jgi:hypothetical protein
MMSLFSVNRAKESLGPRPRLVKDGGSAKALCRGRSLAQPDSIGNKGRYAKQIPVESAIEKQLLEDSKNSTFESSTYITRVLWRKLSNLYGKNLKSRCNVRITPDFFSEKLVLSEATLSGEGLNLRGSGITFSKLVSGRTVRLATFKGWAAFTESKGFRGAAGTKMSPWRKSVMPKTVFESVLTRVSLRPKLTVGTFRLAVKQDLNTCLLERGYSQ